MNARKLNVTGFRCPCGLGEPFGGFGDVDHQGGHVLVQGVQRELQICQDSASDPVVGIHHFVPALIAAPVEHFGGSALWPN